MNRPTDEARLFGFSPLLLHAQIARNAQHP
jgi:hypothetical protein